MFGKISRPWKGWRSITDYLVYVNGDPAENKIGVAIHSNSSWVQIRTQIIEICPKTIFSYFSHERLILPNFQGWFTIDSMVIALSEMARCCFCLLTAHSTVLPVNPHRYALINHHDRLMNQRMTSTGQASRYLIAAALASANVLTLSSPRYLYLTHPQYYI